MSETSALRKFIDIRPDERRIAALMCSYFFLVITSFWILKPIKKTLFLGYYADSGFDLLGRHMAAPEAELLAKVANMFVAVVATAVFSILSRSLRREQLTYVFTVFFIVAYGCFGIWLGMPSGASVWSFYLFGDLFSTLMVATFFSFLNDSVSSDAAKRLYGVVGFGGVAGGAFGSSAVAVWIGSMSVEGWLTVAAVVGFAILLVARAAAQSLPDYSDEIVPSPEPTGSSGESGAQADQPAKESAFGAAFAGVRLVFASRYLLSIVAIVGLYELVSTVLDFQFSSAIVAFSENAEVRNQNFANVFATTNWLSMIVQLFLTSFVMRRFGLSVALMVLPFTITMASMGFVAMPSLLMGALLSVSDNGFSYSINQSSKEALYVPTSVEEKYKAKAFIDMFVQRFAKALGVGLSLLVASRFQGVDGIRQLSFFLLPALLLWSVAAIYAGRRFAEFEEQAAAARDTDA